MRSFSIVVAADLANGIGLNGTLPWRLRKDMAFFAKITSKVVHESLNHSNSNSTRVNACIMGRRTWESIPTKFRPLSARFNVIVSRNPHYLDDKPEKDNPMVAVATSFEAALDLVESLQTSPATTTTTAAAPSVQVDRIFLIGGAQLYDQGVQSKDCTHIFLTRVQKTVDCDTFFPEIKDTEYKLLSSSESHTFLEQYLDEPVEGGVIEEGGFKYEYTVYNRI
ncbi:hypothetical protein BGZ76_006007 [Entomortierella beljakovae]|nr:hypothetical protein BGZ76_006007 [Entomortierella beljakovae]